MQNIIEISDSELITDILNKAFMTVALQFHFTEENAPQFPAFINCDVIEKQLNSGLKMYGYAIGNKIVGCAGYSYYKDTVYFIERLATLPECRHSGNGRKLMEFIENKIVEKGGEVAEIHVVDKNTVLREWYKKLNYREIRIDELTHLPFNSCVMNKKL